MVKERKWGTSANFGPRQWFRHKLLAKAIRRYVSSGWALDAGCGQGGMSLWLLENGYQVWAFDESQEGIASVARKAPKINCFRGKLEEIPLEDESMDLVVAGDVLEHIGDDEKVVREFFRILKPRGTAIVSVPADPKKWSIDDEWSGHKRRYTKSALEQLFQSAGFLTKECFYWGWPLTWLYYRVFYLKWLKRKLKESGRDKEIQGFQGSKLWSVLFWGIFWLDWLSVRLPFGIGLIGIFRKR